MWRVDCDWYSCRRPARLREVDQLLNCCGDAKCIWELEETERMAGVGKCRWRRMTLFRRLRRAVSLALDRFGEFLYADSPDRFGEFYRQLCGLLSRLIAGRFWRRPEPKDYEEV